MVVSTFQESSMLQETKFTKIIYKNNLLRTHTLIKWLAIFMNMFKNNNNNKIKEIKSYDACQYSRGPFGRPLTLTDNSAPIGRIPAYALLHLLRYYCAIQHNWCDAITTRINIRLKNIGILFFKENMKCTRFIHECIKRYWVIIKKNR